MPERLALCGLGAPGWGEPWFPHSAVLLLLLTDLKYGDVCVWVPFFTYSSAIPIIWMKTVISLLSVTDVCGIDQPFTLPCLFCLCVVVVLLVCCFLCLVPPA